MIKSRKDAPQDRAPRNFGHHEARLRWEQGPMGPSKAKSYARPSSCLHDAKFLPNLYAFKEHFAA